MEKTISLALPLWQRIEERGKDVSMVMQDALERHYALLDMTGEDMAGYFFTDEAVLLCDVFRSTGMDLGRLKSWPALLAWDVEDVEKYEKLGSGSGVDVDTLIDKLEKLTPLRALWVWDRIRLFWDMHYGEKPRDETIGILFRTEG
jgi:hypothetical protein